eukprot:jgi/Psemu1/180477/e_gw1.15.63.1
MTNNKSNILYVNLIVQSVSEAVKEKVTTKLERTKLIPNVVVAQAAHTASEFASPKYVTIKMSDQLCKKIPEGLKKNGIDTKMAEVFRENTFAVLQLTVINVDSIVLASASESAWTEKGLSCFLDCIGTSNRKIFEEDYLPKIVTRTLASMMPQIIAETLSDKKIDAETNVNKASEQAVYFFSTLNKLRTAQADERSNRNPINKIRKKIGSQSSVSGGSHRRAGSLTTLGSISFKRINSQSSLGNASERSLASMYSVDGVDDDKTVDTFGSRTSRGSRSSHASGSKGSRWLERSIPRKALVPVNLEMSM